MRVDRVLRVLREEVACLWSSCRVDTARLRVLYSEYYTRVWKFGSNRDVGTPTRLSGT